MYTRYNLLAYTNGKLPQGGGNNLSLKPSWFRYITYLEYRVLGYVEKNHLVGEEVVYGTVLLVEQFGI